MRPFLWPACTDLNREPVVLETTALPVELQTEKSPHQFELKPVSKAYKLQRLGGAVLVPTSMTAPDQILTARCEAKFNYITFTFGFLLSYISNI